MVEQIFMSAGGTWKVTASTRVGPQIMHLHIVTQGDRFTGRIESPMGDWDIAGRARGNVLSWVTEITKPMSMKVTFEIAVDGDTITGMAKMGFLGNAKLKGERIAPSALSAESRAHQNVTVGLVTGDSIDPQFNDAYIDVNELRMHPVPHRYVHGGFKETDARFSFYFPPKEQYEGRFFHNTYPMATTSDIGPFPIAFDVATGDLGFTFASGAYYVQTNLGGADRAPPADPAIAAFRVNAAAAKYSRVVAVDLYGEHRPYGYLFGGSGGSYQTIGAAENTVGVWSGFVPFVMAAPNAIPSMFTVRMHALGVLRHRNKFPAIVDAVNPGGSGDPYAELNDEERAALKEATLMGYPLRGWFNHETLTSGYFYNVAPLMPMLDPTYVEEFWTQPGYLGSDSTSSIKSERFHFDTTVAKVVGESSRRFELTGVPDRDFADAHLVLMSGASKGRSVPIASINGKTIGFAFAADQAVINSVQPGDQVRIDNSWVLALQTYQRHQVPTPDMYGWNQFRGADGQPVYPQRDALIGPIAAAGTAGSVPNGRIHGKMIVLQAVMDIDAFAWQADWYKTQVKAQLGSRFEDSFALWFIDHAQHDNPLTSKAHAHTVSFAGALQQALRDVSAWVERGMRPAETQYEMIDSQVNLPANATARKGIQPVIELQANGGVRADVKVNQSVTFTATIEVPPNAGKLVAAEWDFEGVGTYPTPAQIHSPQMLVRLSTTHSFGKPGTYFTVLRATSQRQGNEKTPFGRVQNIARARVVVS
jgi:hypothetical protein